MFQDVKFAFVLALTTISTGVGHLLDYIPNDIGKLSILVTIILSLVLIFTHLRRSRAKALVTESQLMTAELEQSKLRLEIAHLNDSTGLVSMRS
ncbi:MAG: hypothetical protein KAS93_08230 [Gammaproteobacteria bacterium]|nr:hypothetical protein [Gammaproteobacteria bacterium]